MPIKLNFAIIQELIKEQHKDPEKLDLYSDVLPNDDAVVIKLVEGVIDVYGKKNNTAHYGVFSELDDPENEKFPAKFKAYFDLNGAETAEAFVILSKQTMYKLWDEAGRRTASTGGYLLFADYESGGVRFLMIVMLKPKDGIRLKKTKKGYKPEDIEQLDLGSVHQAARINYERYTEYGNATDEERKELNYLSFVSPSAGHAAAGYFVIALGCSKGTASSRATQNVINISKRFFHDDPDLKTKRLDFTEDLMNYLGGCVENDRSAKLTDLEKLARKYFPADKADDLADKYVATLNNEENAVPIEFPVHTGTLKKINYVSDKTPNWEIRIQRKALGVGEDAPVRFHNNKLIFSDLPKEFIDHIRRTLLEDQKLKDEPK